MSKPTPACRRLRVVLVTGLSGGGKSSVLRALEDLGYEAVDNPPLSLLEEMVSRSERALAVGVDARTAGFDAERVLDAMRRLRSAPGLRAELVYVWAEDAVLLRRYSETRRRHPLAPQGRVLDGIAREQDITAPLRDAADLVVDTSDLPLAAMRRRIEQHFGSHDVGQAPSMAINLVSFAYPHGLPGDADLVFDARFLRNPHYDTILRPLTGLDARVGAFIEADPAFAPFFARLTDLLDLLLPRFVQEGKKYATVAIGCTGGRHRSVHLVEKLADHFTQRIVSGAAGSGWRLHVTHREFARQGYANADPANRPDPRRDGAAVFSGEASRSSPVQAQEA